MDVEIDKIVEMKNLTNLSLSKTNISALPERFGDLAKVSLFLHSTPARRNMPADLKAKLEAQGCTISPDDASEDEGTTENSDSDSD